MRPLALLATVLVSSVSVLAGEDRVPADESAVSPPDIEPADLAELPWTRIGHLDIPGWGSLVNIGFISGQYPQPPTQSGSLLFVPGGNYTTSLVVVDLADAVHPALVADYTGVRTRAVAIQGTLLYSVDGYDRFSVLDISDPAHPRVLGSLQFNPTGLGAAAESVAVAGSVAYITGGGPFLGSFPALRMIDVSDPARPRALGASTEPDVGGADVVVRDGYAYVAAYAAGLKVYDVRSGTAPALVATAGTLGEAGQVRLSGPFAYVLNGGFMYSLAVVDVSDPSHPVTKGAVAIPSSFACSFYCNNSYFQGIVVSGHTVSVSGYGGLVAVDVSDPAHPSITGRFAPQQYTGGVAAWGEATVSLNRTGVDVVRLGTRPIAVASPGLDAAGHLVLDGRGSHDDDGQVVAYDWSLRSRLPQGPGYDFTGATVALEDVESGVYDTALTVHDDSGLVSEPGLMALAVPSRAEAEELADCRDHVADLLLDLEEGAAGLGEIESLVTTVPGRRQSTSHYERELGDELNRIIELLLLHRAPRTQPAGSVSRIPVQPAP
jgi:hypothetical protein